MTKKAKEIITLLQCKDEIAKKWQYEDWEALRIGFSSSDGLQFVDARSDEAAEIYANQFKKSVVYDNVISDDDIIAAVIKAYPDEDRVIQRRCYEFGAKWYRRQSLVRSLYPDKKHLFDF